jgi:hypothetical protein
VQGQLQLSSCRLSGGDISAASGCDNDGVIGKDFLRSREFSVSKRLLRPSMDSSVIAMLVVIIAAGQQGSECFVEIRCLAAAGVLFAMYSYRQRDRRRFPIVRSYVGGFVVVMVGGDAASALQWLLDCSESFPRDALLRVGV